jgi:predicted metalloendopeptidase
MREPLGSTLVRRHRGLSLVLAVIAAGSIGVALAQSKPAASPAVAAAVHGLDPADMNPSAKACQDYYQFADGGWLKKNPIPPEYPSWGTFTELAERNREAMHKILEKLAKEKSPPGSEEQKIGDFYASCMDEAAIEAAGAKPLSAELARIDKIQNLSGLQEEVATLQSRGVGAVFGFGSQQDRKNSSEVIAGASQGGLGLPDRDYYTKTDDRSKELRGSTPARRQDVPLLGDDPARPRRRRSRP